MGTGTFSEEGEQERKRRGSAKVLFTLPTLLSNLPTLCGQKRIRCPPLSLNVKRDLSKKNYREL